MKVEIVKNNPTIGQVSNTKTQAQLDWVKQNVVQARRNGKSEFFFLTKNADLVKRVEMLYGERVSVEDNGTKKVTIKLEE